MDILLRNISKLYRVATQKELVKSGNALADACLLENAWIFISGSTIKEIGVEGKDAIPQSISREIDCSGRIVFPGFCDSHTHLVFARSREEEFEDKIKGLSYEEIAKRGGGILNSAKKLRETSEDDLLKSAIIRANEILQSGTTTVEIKSGYGLTLKDELKMLRVARKVGEQTALTVKTTLLAAHAIPPEYKENREGYINLIITEIIPAAAKEKLTDFVDVFCETGYFTVSEMEQIMQAGLKYGLRPKLHVNQFNVLGGVVSGVNHRALSVDHLEQISDADIDALGSSETIATLLPGCSFFLGIDFSPARRLINSGVKIALATDYNPGSSPSGSMPFVFSLACIKMKLLPEEALCATTLNGAAALGLSASKGSIEPGKDADLVITHPMENLAQVPYFFSKNPVWAVLANGEIVFPPGL